MQNLRLQAIQSNLSFKIFQGGSCYFDTHRNPSLTLIDLYEVFKHHFQNKNRSYDEPSQC